MLTLQHVIITSAVWLAWAPFTQSIMRLNQTPAPHSHSLSTVSSSFFPSFAFAKYLLLFLSRSASIWLSLLVIPYLDRWTWIWNPQTPWILTLPLLLGRTVSPLHPCRSLFAFPPPRVRRRPLYLPAVRKGIMTTAKESNPPPKTAQQQEQVRSLLYSHSRFTSLLWA